SICAHPHLGEIRHDGSSSRRGLWWSSGQNSWLTFGKRKAPRGGMALSVIESSVWWDHAPKGRDTAPSGPRNPVLPFRVPRVPDGNHVPMKPITAGEGALAAGAPACVAACQPGLHQSPSYRLMPKTT